MMWLGWDNDPVTFDKDMEHIKSSGKRNKSKLNIDVSYLGFKTVDG